MTRGKRAPSREQLLRRIAELESEVARLQRRPVRVEVVGLDLSTVPRELVSQLASVLQSAATKRAAVDALAHRILGFARSSRRRRGGPRVTMGSGRPVR